MCRRLTLDDAGISSYRPEIANRELHRIIPSPRIGSYIGCSLAFSPAARRCARCTTTDIRDSQFFLNPITRRSVGFADSTHMSMALLASASRNTLLIYQMTDYCSKRSKVGSSTGHLILLAVSTSPVEIGIYSDGTLDKLPPALRIRSAKNYMQFQRHPVRQNNI